MAAETNLTPLNFNAAIVSKSILDRKNGIEIIFGYVTGMPFEYAELLNYHGGFCFALQDRGITQEILDHKCRKLIEDCAIEKLDILLTKGDLPFDPRWFFIGDITKLMELAVDEKIALPVSPALYDEIYDELMRYFKG